MNKLVKRLLTFFIGVPAVFSIIIFLPFRGHLAWSICVIFFSVVGAIEFSSMLKRRQQNISKIEAGILGALFPLAGVLTVNLQLPHWIVPLVLISAGLWILFSRAFCSLEKMNNVAGFVTAGFSVLLYPGAFLFWVIKLCGLNNTGIVLLYFLITFGSDAWAWLFGSLFGKNNNGIIPASPNKSIAGFIGGLIGSTAFAVGAVFIVPGIFYTAEPSGSLLCKAVILGICTAITATLGDLAESAIKRSCDTKDSGKLMFGRGGVLDSIDSIIAASPVYYALFIVFFVN